MNTDNIVIGEEFSNGMLELEKFDHDYIADISDYLLSIPETFLLLSKPEIKFIINHYCAIDFIFHNFFLPYLFTKSPRTIKKPIINVITIRT